MRTPAFLLAFSVAFASGCASSPPAAEAPTPAPEPEAPPPPAAAPLPAHGPVAYGRTMPAFQPSGIKEDWKRCTVLEAAVKAARALDEQAAAKRDLADHLAGFPARWDGKEIHAPEAIYYAVMLQKCRLYPEAARQARRYIEVAPEDSPNYANAHTTLITSLALAGEFDAAEAELKAVAETLYGDRMQERRNVEETIANCMLKANRPDLAAERFRALGEGLQDLDNARMAVDCYLRLDRVEDARALAARMAGLPLEGRKAEFARWLVAQLDLIGKPAPGFAGTRWWKGVGDPVRDEDLKGKVTVVFSWNMKSAWNPFFFERLAQWIKDFEGRPVQVVGISRLARYDAVTGESKEDMTEEEELQRYDMWAQQYPVACPLAVAGYQETTLLDAWAAYTVPYFVIVGKDGIVASVRSGKNEEHFAALKETVERALAR